MYLILAIYLILAPSSVLAKFDKNTDKIYSNLFISKKEKYHKKTAVIDFEVDKEGKAGQLKITDNGLPQSLISQCVKAIYKSEPLPISSSHVSLPCDHKKTEIKDSPELKKATKEYMTSLQKKIKSNWYPPRNPSPYVVGVKFSVNTKGQAQNIKVLEHGPNADIDLLAIKAVENSSPFGPLPEGLANHEGLIDIDFSFDYTIPQKRRSNNLDKINFGLNLLELIN